MENYTSDSSDSDNNDKSLDLAYLLLDQETVERNLREVSEDPKRIAEIEKVILHHNSFHSFPKEIFKFQNIRVLDVSNNGLTVLPDVFEHCPLLSVLIAKNNSLRNESLPKTFTRTTALRELNLSGNSLERFPEQIFEFVNLKYLYLGGNKIGSISKDVWKLQSLQILSMGGNELVEVPWSLGKLKHLYALMLCDNKLESLPSNIADLNNLKTLLLHKNKLRTLPPAIIALRNLTELSLRDNPLVVRFVSNINHTAPTLLELSARAINLHNIDVQPGDIPRTLLGYLHTARHCVNPYCKGVYFDNRVEHVKFVDFCGKYRIPLLQYLCSTKCATGSDEEVVRPLKLNLMKKVLLG